MSFDKIIGKNIIKNISESLSGKYSQKRLDHAKQSAKMGLKLLQREPFKKKAEATGDLIGNKIQKIATK